MKTERTDKQMKVFSCLLSLCIATVFAFSARTVHADELPVVKFYMVYTDSKGDTNAADLSDYMEASLYDGEEEYVPEGKPDFVGPLSAPIRVAFRAEVENAAAYDDISYRWIMSKVEPYQEIWSGHADEAEREFPALTESGNYQAYCCVTLTKGDQVFQMVSEPALGLTVATSKLEVPNAFTPNGDGMNDVFKMKDGHESIVEFHAMVFNRSGKKIYEWTNPDDGWDGTMNGHGGVDAPDGAYYLVLKARGADGLKYDRKMTINLLRGYNERAAGN